MADERKLLVPIDGSANALRALAFAIKRAARDKRLRICLLNVQAPVPPSLFVTRAMIAAHHEAQSRRDLARSRRLLSKHRVRAQVEVRVGEVAETIVKFARQRHCGEIVMGTRGLGGLKGLLLGAVTTRVIHLSTRPITVVP